MSAHYSVRLEDESGDVLAQIQDTCGLVDDVIVPHSVRGNGIARHIDPYGTTSFNGLQSDALLDEIESIPPDKFSSKQLQSLNELAALLRQAVSEVHLRVSFLGD